MKKIFLSVLLLISMSSNAQNALDKGLCAINKSSGEAIIGFLANDELGGREPNTVGGRIAAEYLKASLQNLGIKPLDDTYFQGFSAFASGKGKRGKASFYVHPDSITAYKKNAVYRELPMRNVLGMIEGKNRNEYVVVGAHYDHLGTDPTLAGDKIYNGADDNASGVSAVLQLAKAFVASGQQPERNVIFAFWDGEELGLLGSEYFMLHCPFTSSIKGYLNFDMIGRNKFEDNPNYVVYFYTESHPLFGDWLKEDIKKYKLQLAPNYRPWDKPIGGSDNGSFALRNIPIIWYHTDGHPDYHQPGDEANKINYNKLIEITKSSFLNLWRLANEKTY